MNKYTKLAMLYDSDKDDMEACIRDVMNKNKVDFPTALRIAQSLRSKYLPEIAKYLDLDEGDIKDLLEKDFSDLSSLKKRDESKDNEPEADASNDDCDETVDDVSEKEDDSIAKIELMVPESKATEIQKAIEEALGDSSFSEFVKIEDEFDADDESAYETIEKNKDQERIAQSATEYRKYNEFNNKRGEIKIMTQKEKNMRKAEREAIVKDAEMLLNDSTEPFKYSEKGQYNKDVDYPTMKFENDGNDSLAGDTSDFQRETDKTAIPTTNGPKDLLLHEDYEIFHFDGTPDGGYQYTLPETFFEDLHNIPNQGVEVAEEFKVPTRMTRAPRKTIVQSSKHEHENFDFVEDLGDGAEDDVDVELTGRGKGKTPKMNVEETEMIPLGDEVEDNVDDAEEAFTPEEILHAVDCLDDEELNEFVSGLRDWARENGVSLDVVEEDSEDNDMKRESIASVLGPEFDLDKAEEVLYSQLRSAGVKHDDIAKLTYAQGINLAHKITKAQSTTETMKLPGTFEFKASQSADGSDMSDTDADQLLNSILGDEDTDNGPSGSQSGFSGSSDSNMNATPMEVQASAQLQDHLKKAELREMRLKTAYDVWAKLANAGIISVEDITENVDNWLDEGLTVKSMINQGNIMLKTASAATRKATASNNNNVVLGNTLTNPAFSGGTSGIAKSSVQDMKSALQGLFTTVEVPDDNK